MSSITLKNTSSEGVPMEATFLPDKGMNMVSFTLGDIEVIDQSTCKDFERRFAGLGPLIGPHFHRRKPSLIPKVADESAFPHIAYFKEEGRLDPFSHGVARYAPWRAEATQHAIHATLSGDDTWNGVSLSALEGQNFKMTFDVVLTPEGLQLTLSVVSDADSIVGIHYYYHLPNGMGKIVSKVQNAYIINGEKKPLPFDWDFDSQNVLKYPLSQETDVTLFPYPDPLQGKIILETETHHLITTYQNASQENSWQLWHPKGASFVCIEPVSAQDPRHPNLTVSAISIQLQIFPCQK